jgi:hypothetical protein
MTIMEDIQWSNIIRPWYDTIDASQKWGLQRRLWGWGFDGQVLWSGALEWHMAAMKGSMHMDACLETGRTAFGRQIGEL